MPLSVDLVTQVVFVTITTISVQNVKLKDLGIKIPMKTDVILVKKILETEDTVTYVLITKN